MIEAGKQVNQIGLKKILEVWLKFPFLDIISFAFNKFLNLIAFTVKDLNIMKNNLSQMSQKNQIYYIDQNAPRNQKTSTNLSQVSN